MCEHKGWTEIVQWLILVVAEQCSDIIIDIFQMKRGLHSIVLYREVSSARGGGGGGGVYTAALNK